MSADTAARAASPPRGCAGRSSTSGGAPVSGVEERGAAAGAGLRSANAPITATTTTNAPAAATGTARFLSIPAITRAG